MWIWCRKKCRNFKMTSEKRCDILALSIGQFYFILLFYDISLTWKKAVIICCLYSEYSIWNGKEQGNLNEMITVNEMIMVVIERYLWLLHLLIIGSFLPHSCLMYWFIDFETTRGSCNIHQEIWRKIDCHKRRNRNSWAWPGKFYCA